MAAMPRIIRGESVLLCGPTASGKTEAVVAPLFQRHLSFRRDSLSVIYTVPTKALVNDLYHRLSDYLGADSSTRIKRYSGDHHELNAIKGAFLVLTTPEALDSFQLMHPERLVGVRAIIIDEIHFLHGRARGQQLRYVIKRICGSCSLPKLPKDHFQLVGMSATVNDMEGVANLWLGQGAAIVSSGEARKIEMHLLQTPTSHFRSMDRRAKVLIDSLEETRSCKVLVFANTRNAAHALAAALESKVDKARWPVYMHIGILSKTERERIEMQMKSGRLGICVATSTMEIGIDIGDIDMVVLAEPPGSINAFLQRIGRGNRRTGICRVLALYDSEREKMIYEAMLHCAKTGQLDEVHEYDRPSVRFQQVLSFAWKATRADRSLTRHNIHQDTGGEGHCDVIDDMLGTGTLREVHGALIPSDDLMDEGDARRVHTVLSGSGGMTMIDSISGEIVVHGLDGNMQDGMIFIGGRRRTATVSSMGEIHLSPVPARHGMPLVRLPTARGKRGLCRRLIWGIAELSGFDPKRWQIEGNYLRTWGGYDFNRLLSVVLKQSKAGEQISADDFSVTARNWHFIPTPAHVRMLTIKLRESGQLPARSVGGFREPTRFFIRLSERLQRIEIHNSVPLDSFIRWLDECRSDFLAPSLD